MQCSTPYCETKLNPKTFQSIKFIEEKDVMRPVCSFHYADWQERTKNA